MGTNKEARCYLPAELVETKLGGVRMSFMFSECGHAYEKDGEMYCEKGGAFQDYGMRCGWSVRNAR